MGWFGKKEKGNKGTQRTLATMKQNVKVVRHIIDGEVWYEVDNCKFTNPTKMLSLCTPNDKRCGYGNHFYLCSVEPSRTNKYNKQLIKAWDYYSNLGLGFDLHALCHTVYFMNEDGLINYLESLGYSGVLYHEAEDLINGNEYNSKYFSTRKWEEELEDDEDYDDEEF